MNEDSQSIINKQSEVFVEIGSLSYGIEELISEGFDFSKDLYMQKQIVESFDRLKGKMKVFSRSIYSLLKACSDKDLEIERLKLKLSLLEKEYMKA